MLSIRAALPFLIATSIVTAVTVVGQQQQPPPRRPADVPALAERGPLTIDAAAIKELEASVKAPPGFKVDIFAAPPSVNYPTCVTAALDGALYVCVDRNSSLQTDPEMGSILRLVDKDGDGRADEYTLFARLDSPRGAVFDGQTLFVTHPPFLSALRDTNGDGVADETRTLVRGLGFGLDFRGADHTTNGIEFGPDGWLYVAVGDYGFVKAAGADGREIQLRGGGNVRVRPDGSDLEIYSRGTRNDYDIAIDPAMNLFARGNTNDGGGWDIRLNHFVAGANYGYPSLFRNFADEVVAPLADYGGGSGSGMLYVDDPGFPREFGDTLYSVDWGTNQIYRHPLTARGATFKAGQEIFLTIPRPTDLAIDGASRLYAASWRGGQYRYGGELVGFIARLTHPGTAPATVPDIAGAADARLVDILTSANFVHRRFAQHEILRRGSSPERAALLEKRMLATGPVAGRLAALFTLGQLAGAQAHPALIKASADPALRAAALRTLADRPGAGNVTASTFVQALGDSDARVRLQAVTALSRLGAVDAAAAILPLTTDADPVVAHVAIDAVASLHAVDAALAVVNRGSPAQAKAALRALQRMHGAPAVSGLIAALGKTTAPETRLEILQALARLYHRDGVWRGTVAEWWGTRPDTTGPYYDPVAWEQSPRILPVLRAAFLQTSLPPAARNRLAADLTRNRILPPGGAELLNALVESRSPSLPAVADLLLGRPRVTIDATAAKLLDGVSRTGPSPQAAVVRLIAGSGAPSPDAAALLARVAADRAVAPAVRAQALTALLAATDADALGRAIDAFATVDTTVTPDPALDAAWRQFVGQPSHAQHVARFQALTATQDRARQVLGYAVLLQLAAEPAAGRGGRGGGGGGGGRGRGASQADAEAARTQARAAIDSGWASPSSPSLLRAIGLTQASGYGDRVAALAKSEDAEVRDAAAFATSHSREATMARGATLVAAVPYEELGKRLAGISGDVAVGRTVFTRQGCAACHTASPEETEKGPYLGGITTRYSREELLESILRPAAKVAQGFATNYFDTADGRQVQGFVIREGNLDVVIRDLTGAETTLQKNQIKSRGVREGSVMPPGLMDTATLQELASLLTFLGSTSGK
jgi:putative heme-binding domain-containing protein